MSKATEQMYILLEPEEDGAASPLSPLLTELVAALQDIKQLQPPLLALEGELRGICANKICPKYF